MLPSRWLIAGFVALATSLLLACGPNALPRRAAAAVEPVAAIQAGAAPQVPVAQLIGGSQLEGRLLFVKEGNVWLWENGGARPLGEGDTWRQPRWAPDGKRFAYVLRGNSFSDIVVADLQGNTQTRLTRSQSRILEENDWNFRPTWSPDGKQIAFISDASSSNLNLWLMNAADGSGKRPLATPGLVQETVDELAWSPDGSQLAVALFSGGVSQVAIVPTGTRARQSGQVLTDIPGGALDPAWSPDGRWIAYAAREGKGVDVFVMAADGSRRQRLTDDGLARSPAWSPDGRSIAYLSAQGGTFDVWVVDVQAPGSSGLEATGRRQLTRNLGLDATSGVSWGR